MFGNDWVGKEVVFEDNYKDFSLCYPPYGTIGKVLSYIDSEDKILVQWPKGTTSDNDRWWVFPNQKVRLVKEDIENMSSIEIWKMLRNKMRKNGIHSFTVFGANYYDAKDVYDAVALAYKVGYLRAKKGRPFKYNHKK